MKENVLDVLMYLFEHYIYDEPEQTPDRALLENSLSEAGFTDGEIHKAFRWLDDLADQRSLEDVNTGAVRSLRLYAPVELERLDESIRGLLLYLEQAEVLDMPRRELVIDRLMALEDEEITLDDVKWVVLMVLFNQPGQEANYAWMEDYLFDEAMDIRH